MGMFDALVLASSQLELDDALKVYCWLIAASGNRVELTKVTLW